jgi:hypothetical protein
MSLTKEQVIDKIEIVDNELSKSYHRWSIAPGQDYSDQPDNVKAICAVAHTPAVIAAYEAAQAAALERIGAV